MVTTTEQALLNEPPRRSPKTTAAAVHQPRLVAPFFAAAGDGTTLHRYLDDDFVARFLDDAHSNRLTGMAAQPWFSEDRFGGFKNEPTLRLPMHRSFYLACVEVQCAIPGTPAFDPRKITGAGMVVRRTPANAQPQRWMIVNGQPQGWHSGPIPDHDPDDVRRLIARGLLPQRFPEPPYSGEEIAPLHPIRLQRRDANGKIRSHTLLWGYLPLGGSAREHADTPLPAQRDDQAPDFDLEHAWPLGSRNARQWTAADGQLVTNGIATAGFIELLQTLLTQFRIYDSSDADNAGLRALLSKWHFHTLEQHSLNNSLTPSSVQLGDETVLEWLEQSNSDLIGLFARIARDDATADSDRLPAGNGTSRTDHLLISEQQAADLRSLVALRLARAQLRFDDGLALPRYGQSDDDCFVALPFMRWTDQCGCEQVSWGPASPVFRVASPFDPEAQRPTTIVLPSLGDLKRGLPRGVAMLAPKSLADVLRKIKLGIDINEGGPGNRSGSCWSFGFSLPAITLCAMLLLMIVLSLLDLIFRWLPWVFIALPRLCLKALKGK